MGLKAVGHAGTDGGGGEGEADGGSKYGLGPVGFALAFGGTALLSRAVQSESEGGERGGQAGPPGGASDQEASFRDPLIRA